MADATIQERFAEFHRDNPKVYELFQRFTYQALQTGRKRFGARMIWERMRWYTTVETNDLEFKLNDHYPPYYARLFMARHPKYAGFFETRGD